MASRQHPPRQEADSRERLAFYLLSAGALLLAVIAVAFCISDLIELYQLLAAPTRGLARP